MSEGDSNQVLLEMERVLREEAEKRRKQIMHREIPAKRTLANALQTLTRQDLEDIRYNVGLSGVSGTRIWSFSRPSVLFILTGRRYGPSLHF